MLVRRVRPLLPKKNLLQIPVPLDKRREKGGSPEKLPPFGVWINGVLAYTQPVGLGRPAILQAPLPGPEGNSS